MKMHHVRNFCSLMILILMIPHIHGQGPPFCKFPFIYKNVTYTACTAYDESDGTDKLWCSTRTDNLNNHVKGYWRHCRITIPTQTFYQIPMHSDYEVRLNFSANSQPTVYEWFFGASFQEKLNLIQIPSDNGKFSTSLTDLENGNYQAILGITGITEEDFSTKFMFHVKSDIFDADYRIVLSKDEKPTGCPDGFFMVTGSTECFKMFRNTQRNWFEAKRKCQAEGLSVAMPADEVAVTLRKYLLDTYGDWSNVWLDGRGDGTSLVWQHNGEELSNDNPLWFPGYPGKDITTNHCMAMAVWERGWGMSPATPYASWACLGSFYALCEVPDPFLFNFTQIIVNPKEKFQLECGVTGDYRFCVWEREKLLIPSVREKEMTIFQVDDVHNGVYRDMGPPENKTGNQCGIVVDQNTTEYDGIWTCKIFISLALLEGSKNVIIPVKPTEAEMSAQQVITKAGELQEVKCSVMAAQPAVSITWTINGTDITSDAQTEERPNNHDGTYMTLSTLRRDFKPKENGQKLECVVAHYTLDEPEITTVPITVFWGPSTGFPDAPNIFYQIPMDIDYEIRLNFSANPRPTAHEWSYGANFQEMPNIIQIPSDNGKFSTSLIDLGNDNYQVLLKIDGLTEVDFATRFKLHVANEIDGAYYEVILSMDEKPVGCPEGFFMIYGSKPCFKIFNAPGTKRTWNEAKLKCEEEELILAKPSDAIAVDLRKYLLDKHGNGAVWLDAQGDGSTFVWNHDGTELRSDNPLWWPSSPGSWVTPRHCLLMLVLESNWNSHHGRPYFSYPCSRSRYTLCEAVNGTITSNCNDTCSTEKQWVCGTNNENYQNPCQLKVSACQAPEESISIKHRGKCVEECQNEFFSPTDSSSTQCFKIFTDEKITWDKSQAKCQKEGLRTAKPADAVAVTLRKYLVDNKGDVPVWLAARGDGSKFVWIQDNTTLSSDSSLWLPGEPTSLVDTDWSYPGDRVTHNHCLTLMVQKSEWSHRPTRPYGSFICSTPRYTLCEGCPAGFFVVKGSKKCFKFFHTKSTWEDTKAMCADEGLLMAQPSDDEVAETLRNYIIEIYGDHKNVWLDARGDGSNLVWEHDGVELRKEKPLMISGLPDISPATTNHCLYLKVEVDIMRVSPGEIYGTRPCSNLVASLCEVMRE